MHWAYCKMKLPHHVKTEERLKVYKYLHPYERFSQIYHLKVSLQDFYDDFHSQFLAISHYFSDIGYWIAGNCDIISRIVQGIKHFLESLFSQIQPVLYLNLSKVIMENLWGNSPFYLHIWHSGNQLLVTTSNYDKNAI